jgi:hypothetical protein
MGHGRYIKILDNNLLAAEKIGERNLLSLAWEQAK